MRHEHGELRVYASRWKALLLTICMGTCAALLLLAISDRHIPVEALVFFVGLLAFFVCCVLYYLYRLISWRPLLIISDEGIVDNGSVVNVGLIRWDEIQSVQAITNEVNIFFIRTYLCIIPKHIETLKTRQHGVKRLVFIFMDNWTRPLLPSPIAIEQSLLPYKVKDLLPQIALYRKVHPRLAPGGRG